MHISALEELFGGRPAVAARAATDDDPTSEVLVLGIDFAYLHFDDDGKLGTRTEETGTSPSRIVVDADSFLAGAAQRESPPAPGTPGARDGWILAVSTGGNLLQIPAPAPSLPPEQDQDHS
jgi:hypothetical protein